MSLQNEMRRTRKTNLEYNAMRLRREIEDLAQMICLNLDCSMSKPENLLIDVVDSQFDQLKAKWGELAVDLAEIARLEEELR